MESSANRAVARISRRSLLASLAWPAYALADAPNDAVNVRRLGAIGDGVADDTEALIRAHADGRPVFYPHPPRYYRITRYLPVISSVFGETSEIRIVQNGQSETSVFRIVKNEHPLIIQGMVLDGAYSGGDHGEYSAGVQMYGARDVRIVHNTIKNQYGDCVYAGSSIDRVSSRNIVIQDNVLLNPRRCNVAVVCGENVSILGNRMEKSVDYVAAIDLEPNPNGFDQVVGVTINRNVFDVVGTFLAASVNTGRPNTSLVVSRNRGRAIRFCYISSSAVVRHALFSENTFSANTADGVMFQVENARNLTVVDNVDNTKCRSWAYRSVTLDDTQAWFQRNSFCGPLPAPRLRPRRWLGAG